MGMESIGYSAVAMNFLAAGTSILSTNFSSIGKVCSLLSKLIIVDPSNKWINLPVP